MALLTDIQRRSLWAQFMSDVSAREEAFGNLLKADIRAAVDAIDQWVEDNQSSFNSAIPLTARTELSAKQKVEIFKLILDKRFEVS